MSHEPVSVVVTAGGRAGDLRYLLESLGPTLGMRDEVVCIVPPAHAALRSQLQGQRWLRLLDATADDQPGRWAAGVAATTHPVVVLLDGGTVVAPYCSTPSSARSPTPRWSPRGHACTAAPGRRAQRCRTRR